MNTNPIELLFLIHSIADCSHRCTNSYTFHTKTAPSSVQMTQLRKNVHLSENPDSMPETCKLCQHRSTKWREFDECSSGSSRYCCIAALFFMIGGNFVRTGMLKMIGILVFSCSLLLLTSIPRVTSTIRDVPIVQIGQSSLSRGQLSNLKSLPKQLSNVVDIRGGDSKTGRQISGKNVRTQSLVLNWL